LVSYAPPSLLVTSIVGTRELAIVIFSCAVIGLGQNGIGCGYTVVGQQIPIVIILENPILKTTTQRDR
jgi:hypothetical protein